MNNYPHIPATITPPWLVEEDEDLDNYNSRPYSINLSGKTFQCFVDCDARAHIYLDNFSSEQADIATCVYDQVTVAAETIGLDLDGFDGKTFNCTDKSEDLEDRAAAIHFLKDELMNSGGIELVEV